MSTLNNVVLFVLVLVLSVGSVVPVSGQSLIDQAISKAATQAAQQNQGGSATRDGVGTLIGVVGASAIAAGLWTVFEDPECVSDRDAAPVTDDYVGDCETVNASRRYGWTITGVGAGMIILGVAVAKSGGRGTRPSKVPEISISHRGGKHDGRGKNPGNGGRRRHGDYHRDRDRL